MVTLIEDGEFWRVTVTTQPGWLERLFGAKETKRIYSGKKTYGNRFYCRDWVNAEGQLVDSFKWLWLDGILNQKRAQIEHGLDV